MKKKHRRLLITSGLLCFVACIIFLILTVLKENISFFYTVSEAVALTEKKKLIRIGGLVVEGSVVCDEYEVSFQIADSNHSMKVIYKGILPPMFSEKYGVVVQGKIINNNTFLADTVFAKHDEKYMPKKYKNNNLYI